MPRWVESLTINGFKSFAHEQALIFERGLCVLSGPNGAGKSNVVDALLFVLGEGCAKLRAARLADLRSSSVEHAAGSLTCAVTAVIRVLADGECGRHVLVAELKAERCERRLNGESITTKALRDWLQRSGLIAEGAPYYIRQAAVQDAVQSATLYPLIVQASGCSSYLAARADATGRLRADESRLAKLNADLDQLHAACDKAEREHALVVERRMARVEHAQLELVASLAQDERRAAERLDLAERADALEASLEHTKHELAGWRAQDETFAVKLAEVNVGDADAQQRLDSLREHVERLLPQIESDEAALVEARVQMAGAAARLAQIKLNVAAATDNASGTLVKVKALHERRALLTSTEAALTGRWRGVYDRLGAQPERSSAAVRTDLQLERTRLDRLACELVATQERTRRELASSAVESSKARRTTRPSCTSRTLLRPTRSPRTGSACCRSTCGGGRFSTRASGRTTSGGPTCTATRGGARPCTRIPASSTAGSARRSHS